MANLYNFIKRNIHICGIVFISFILRILFSFDNAKMLFGDIETYDAFAMNILEYGVMHNSAYQAPGYTYFLALIYKLFGHSLLNVYIVQCILGSVNTFLIYKIAMYIFNKKIGLLSATLSLMYFPLTLYSGILLSETLFMFLFLSGIYTFLKGLDSRKSVFFLLCGLFLGLSTLTRSITLLFLFIVPITYLILDFKNKAALLRNSLIFIFVFSLVLAPWVVRNYVKYDAFIPVDTLGGVNLYIGNNAKADGTFVSLADDPIYHSKGNDYEIDKKMKSAAVNYILSHPLRTIQLTLTRITLFVTMDFKKFDWVLESYLREHILFKNTFYFWLVLMRLSDVIFYVLGVIGLFTLARNKKGILLLGIILYFFTLTSMFYVQFRYRLPIMPFLAISASLGYQKLNELKAGRLNFGKTS